MTDERNLTKMISTSGVLFEPTLAEVSNEETRRARKERWKKSELGRAVEYGLKDLSYLTNLGR